jgi:hypothetical protein
MKKIIQYLVVAIVTIGLSNNSFAEEWPILKSKPGNVTNKSLAEACLPATAATDLWVNNVRARINTGGDMWWDLQGNAKYFIPGNSMKTSMFSAALWIGGLDINGQLKLAANRYRGNGNDYWTGPLTTDGLASVSSDICGQYDKHFKITRAEVESFLAAYNAGTLGSYEIPKSIKEYPAHGPSGGYAYYLAPFKDIDGDGVYNYSAGDYPYYDFNNELCGDTTKTMEGNGILADQVLKGDETLWWVFNDKGNIHTETKGEAIGMEIRAQAFGFSTNDEINNMTFYSYEIINRSTYRLTQTYFCQWVDTDLGYPKDDYVGCDVNRGLGYCYNGDETDETAGGSVGYGLNPPAIGVDFFQGPYLDKDGFDNPSFNGDGTKGPSYFGSCDIVSQNGALRDFIYGDTTSPDTITGVLVRSEAINGINFGDGIVDNERYGMRRFVYHNNTGGLDAMTDPDIAPEYYNYLRGIWKDGIRMRYWGNGHPSAGGNGPECDFMFPGDTDPCNWGTNGINPGAGTWTEVQAGNAPYDRRFMQSAGPFTLEPGAVNYITVGIPWARATSGGPNESVRLLRLVDDKCQALFDNCFKVLDGPDAPDLTVQELDREIILYVTNPNGNNQGEKYDEVDKTIVTGDDHYRFQGYQIFQVKDASVTATDVHNSDMARLVAQCDIKDGVSRLINFNYNEDLGANVPVEEVNGANTGIVHSFRILEDKFATEDKRLVNHKQYYYIAIAYAYNNFKTYDPTDPEQLDGQKKPYLAGRKGSTGSIKVIPAMPHNPSPEENGTIIHSEYGVMPQITRVEGNGNGGLVLDFTTETRDRIMSGSPYFSQKLTYDYNKGPVNIKVIDPLNVASSDFTLKFLPGAGDDMLNAKWILADNNGNSWNSDTTIKVANEQLILELGLSISIEQPTLKGYYKNPYYGVLEATMEFADSSKIWMSGVPDLDNIESYNWIRSGNVFDDNNHDMDDYDLADSTVGTTVVKTGAIDPSEIYEKLLDGMWAPYRMASRYANGPQFGTSTLDFLSIKKNMLANLYSIDLYITPDKSKWTKCPILEMCEDENSAFAEGNAKKMDLRLGTHPTEGVGMGWFPGYAINVETGERLNMMFGEDSYLQSDNGRDMIWNPTENFTSDIGNIVNGGKHWVYIMGHNGEKFNTTYNVVEDCPAYDEGAWVKSMLYPASNPNHGVLKRFVYEDVMWVGCPMITDSKYRFADPANMPCEVKIRIRVVRPYQRYYSTSGNAASSPLNDNFPMYEFSTKSLAVEKNAPSAAEGALNLINVVPNPYYGYSSYEQNQLDNRVRITNLPQKCKINIYTVNGTLIRQYTKDDIKSYVDWDLKNQAGIPIAGGMYLIYVNVDGVGEKVIKWFGALRPIDLNSF